MFQCRPWTAGKEVPKIIALTCVATFYKMVGWSVAWSVDLASRFQVNLACQTLSALTHAHTDTGRDTMTLAKSCECTCIAAAFLSFLSVLDYF